MKRERMYESLGQESKEEQNWVFPGILIKLEFLDYLNKGYVSLIPFYSF